MRKNNLISKAEMKKIWGGGPIERCAPNGHNPDAYAFGCCSGYACRDFGSAPVCFDPDQGRPCNDVPI